MVRQIAVFVARDQDEFEKYAKWFKARSCRRQVNAFTCLKPANTKRAGLEQSKHLQGRSKPSFSEVELEYFKYVRVEGDLMVVCVQKSDKNGLVFSNARDDLIKMKIKTNKRLSAFVSPFCSLLINLAKTLASDFEDVKVVRIFIHWGAGEPLEFEAKFKGQLEAYKKEYSEVDGVAGMDVSAFAVSSRREKCFNVNKSVIELPETCNELDNLVGKFKEAFSFADVRDLMTKIVVGVLKHRLNKTKRGYKLPYPNEEKRIKRFLELLKDKKTVGFNGMPMREEWKSWLNSVFSSKNNKKHCRLQFDDRAFSLFVTYLEGGMEA